MEKPVEILQKFWGYPSFRPVQEDIINAVLEKKDTLALLPTGGGKSICFQVPALMMEGLCIVVSPLIALMKDQVEQLKNRNIPAVTIYSGMSYKEIDIALDNCIHAPVKFLYVSPERLKTDIFIERAKRMNVCLLAVDEAHCISQWGYDFRPPYLEIAKFREIIPEKNIIALTATATEEVRKDIQEKLHFQNAEVFLKSFARDNLSYATRKEEDKEKKLLEILKKVPGTAIVYVRNRKKTKEVAYFLLKNGISADYYHGGLINAERSKKQDLWIRNRIRAIVSTNAFGMGIDKPDVRTVVHLDLPDTLEAYYQEAGRAGRDEKKAYAVILYNDKDITDLEKKVKESFPSIDFIKKIYQCLANYYKIAVGSNLMVNYDFDIKDFITTYNLPAIETYHAIKKLEIEGFIQLNEGFHKPSKLYFSVDKKGLYEFQIANASIEKLIKALLRIYGGELFTNFQFISEVELSRLIKIPSDLVVEQLQYMHQAEILFYDQQKDKPQITFLTPRYDASKLPVDKQILEQRRKLQLDKMKSVINYVENKIRCRTQFLLDYFDEVSYDKCGVCDNCLNEKKQVNNLISIEKYRQTINEALINPVSVNELTNNLNAKDPELLISIIRRMIDNGEITINAEGLLQRSKQ